MENSFSSRFSFTEEIQRKLIMYYVMNMTGLLVLLILGTVSFLEGDAWLGLIDGFFSLILLALLHFIGKVENKGGIIEITLILLFLFFFYLFISGSARGHTFVWYYSFPIFSMFLLGVKKGLFYSLSLILLSVLPLAAGLPFSFLPVYPAGFLIRFLISYILATFLIFLYERAREETQNLLRKTLDELREQAIRDGLTGLYNRRHLDQIWAFLIRDFHRSRKNITFIMADLDFFKNYNDYYGHPGGDEVLREISALLKSLIRRQTDYVFRYGGEEFSILLYGSDRTTSIALSEEIIRTLGEKEIAHEKSPFGHVTLSLGVVMSSLTRDMKPEEIIQKADDALYRAKNEGRNRYIFIEA